MAEKTRHGCHALAFADSESQEIDIRRYTRGSISLDSGGSVTVLGSAATHAGCQYCQLTNITAVENKWVKIPDEVFDMGFVKFKVSTGNPTGFISCKG